MVLTGVKHWVSDPGTATSLKESGRVAVISGSCCLLGGILFGPVGIGVGAITFGISYYVIDKDTFGSAAYSLGSFIKGGVPPSTPQQ